MATFTSTPSSTTTGARGGSGGGGPGGPPGGGGGGPGGPGAGIPGAILPPPQVRFASTPGELDADDLIDYSTKEGRAAFKIAISSLGDDKFDGKSGGINSFHEKLMRRAKECGWDQGLGDIITVNGINSIIHYGRVTTD